MQLIKFSPATKSSFMLIAIFLFMKPTLAEEVSSQTHDSSVHHEMNHERMNKHIKRMTKKLNLSEEQIKEIKAIQKESKEGSGDLFVEMKLFKGKVKGLFEQVDFDEQAFLLLHQEYQPTFTALALEKAKTRHAMFNILTGEQKEKWLSMKKSRKLR